MGHPIIKTFFSRSVFWQGYGLPGLEFALVLGSVLLVNFTAHLYLKNFGLWNLPFTTHTGSIPALPDIWPPLLAALGCNAAVLWLLRQLYRRVVQPVRRLRQIMHHASTMLITECEQQTFTLAEMASLVARFTTHAQEAYHKCQALEHELEVSRQVLAQIITQQQAIVASTNRELIEQYRSVLAYANYLDEHIRSHQSDAQLRYDFDDVCESGFNLKLIAQSLELLRANQPVLTTVALPALIQQTLIALAPSLERRAMRLSTMGIEEGLAAQADLPMLSHALWMVLLGTIRYAAAESTLRLRCLAGQDGTQAMVSIVISELAPGQLTPEERHAHMVRQLQHMTPHMFAETIRLHANAQLAELMLSAMGGQLQVVHITNHACEILLILPITKK